MEKDYFTGPLSEPEVQHILNLTMYKAITRKNTYSNNGYNFAFQDAPQIHYVERICDTVNS